VAAQGLGGTGALQLFASLFQHLAATHRSLRSEFEVRHELFFRTELADVDSVLAHKSLPRFRLPPHQSWSDPRRACGTVFVACSPDRVALRLSRFARGGASTFWRSGGVCRSMRRWISCSRAAMRSAIPSHQQALFQIEKMIRAPMPREKLGNLLLTVATARIATVWPIPSHPAARLQSPG
jgi:hypothetical protein